MAKDWAKISLMLVQAYDYKSNEHRLTLHHLASGQHIDTLIKKSKKSVNSYNPIVLKLFRDSFLNLYPIDEHRHLNKINLPQIEDWQFQRIYKYFNENRIQVLKKLDFNMGLEESKKLLRVVLLDIFGEIIVPFNELV